MATKIRETIERYWAAFCTNDRDAYLGCFADDAWIEDPLGTPRRNGKGDPAKVGPLVRAWPWTTSCSTAGQSGRRRPALPCSTRLWPGWTAKSVISSTSARTHCSSVDAAITDGEARAGSMSDTCMKYGVSSATDDSKAAANPQR